ncbi:MAG: hypothetical protein AAGH15_04155 [Myxococcota bacterium]
MIVYGLRHYGKVDALGHAPNGGPWVATRFAHIWFLPLIPLGSTLVVADDGKSVNGLKLPLSGKSVAFAYLRNWGVFAALILLFVAGGAVLELLEGLREPALAGWRVNAAGIQVPVKGEGPLKLGALAAAFLGLGAALAIVLLRVFSGRFAAPSPERRRELETMLGRVTPTPSLPVPPSPRSASTDYQRAPAAPAAPETNAGAPVSPERAEGAANPVSWDPPR